MKKKLITLLVILIMALSCVSFIACGDDPGPDPGPGPGGNGTVDPPEDDLTVFNFEAECCILDSDGGIAGTEGAKAKNPSGGAYIYNLSSQSTYATCTFEITSDMDTEAVLSMRMGHREREYSFTDMFNLTVNGAAVRPSAEVTFGMYNESTETKYFAWRDTKIMTIDLKEGNNIIEFAKAGGTVLNFDAIKLATKDAILEWTSEVGVGHTHDEWEVLKDPTTIENGMIGSFCVTCRDYIETTIPAISEENGYSKNDLIAAGEETFGEAEWTYTHDNQNFTFKARTDPTSGNVRTQRFEAERMILGGTAKIYQEVGSNNPSNGSYVGGMSTNVASITLDVISDKKTQAVFIIGYGARNDRDSVFNTMFSLYVSDKKVDVPASLIFYGVDSDFNFFNWMPIEIAIIDLEAGRNIIKLDKPNTQVTSNIDYFELRTGASLEWYEEL